MRTCCSRRTPCRSALCSPLRRRVQQLVDRRLNRARYDAGRTVAAFSALLADTVDLDTIRGSLADAVQQALQPAHLTIWLSQPPQQIRG